MYSKANKSISIKHYLETKGVMPKSIIRGVAKYNSPFREESKPSFHVNMSKNLWYDFGIGKGGSVIDLCMLIDNVDFKSALNTLEDLNLPLTTINNNQYPDNKLTIKSVNTISHNALLKYLKKRSIPFNIADTYLKEVRFSVGATSYFALGFRNKKGGYELRSKYFKGSSSPKYFTFIKGKNSKNINLFEGCFDFLSALSYFKLKIPNNDTIVLNSLTFIKDVYPFLSGAYKINSYLDNDRAGTTAIINLQQKFPKVKNCSKEIYAEFNDFNEFLNQTKHLHGVNN